MRGTSGRQQSELSLSGVTAPVVNLCYACDMQYTQQYGVLGDPPYLSIRLELKGNIGISGPPADSSPSTSSGLCSAIQNGLQYLDFSNMDLTGSLPKCLLSAPDFGAGMYMLQAVLLSDNNLTGTLPSPLATSISATYLDMSDNQLPALPATWTAGFLNVTQSSFVNIFLQQNEIQSPFPAAVAAFPDLLLFHANNN
ncbi:hypothetical protein WJX79_008311 [Trebouxia sp. C0005]